MDNKKFKYLTPEDVQYVLQDVYSKWPLERKLAFLDQPTEICIEDVREAASKRKAN